MFCKDFITLKFYNSSSFLKEFNHIHIKIKYNSHMVCSNLTRVIYKVTMILEPHGSFTRCQKKEKKYGKGKNFHIILTFETQNILSPRYTICLQNYIFVKLFLLFYQRSVLHWVFNFLKILDFEVDS